MIIRKVSLKDLKKVDNIFREEFRKPPYNEKWPKSKSISKLRKYFRNNLTFVLEIKGEIIGFLIGHIEIWDKGDQGFIDEIVISKGFQGKGYGKELIQYFINILKRKRIKKITLMSNPKSKAFKIYKKMGFKELKDFTYLIKKIK